ncbi:hypothetical protein [Canibacter zhoujuaniae]|uniref:hypothetical protein n=1 Tax=Canibacter zhoujuaniae TaxID=2708343 RepID=UPI001423A175|nr:hypothetical protein [Canibacter zhoujuaniae]
MSEENPLVNQIEAALLEIDGVDRVIRVTVIDVDQETQVVGAKISLPADTTMRQVSIAVALSERKIERLIPAAKHIFVTPDVYFDDSGTAPSTSNIVTLSYD